jgi:hypothetical protein
MELTPMAVQQGSWSREDKDAWQRQRLADELARGVHSPNGPVAKYLRNEPPVKSPPKNAFDQLNEKLNKQLQKAVNDAIADKTSPTLDEVQQAAADGHTLRATQESTCFASLEYVPLDAETGTVVATFVNGYGPYEGEMDLDDFIDWADSGSLGGTYNAEFPDLFGPRKPKGKGK